MKTSRLQIFFYRTRLGKPNHTKVGKKNLQVCLLGDGGAVGKEISIWKIIGVGGIGFSKYFEILQKSDNGEVVGQERIIASILGRDLISWG